MRNSSITLLAAALVACAPADQSTAQVAQAIADSSDAATRQSSLISVTRTGNPDGRTVVLIPGLASSAAVWDATVPVLEIDYDIRLVQIAGFASADPVATQGPVTDTIASALTDMLRDSPARDPVLVGHSMGGFVSLKAALKAPELIDELIIVDSVPFLAGLFFPGVTPELAAVQGLVMAEQMAAMPRAAFDARQKSSLPRLVKTASYLSELEDWGLTSDQALVSAVTGEMITADLRADLGVLETQTLVMLPFDQGMGVSREQIEGIYKAQYQAAPNVHFHVVEGSFHFLMLDQPDAFHSSLLSALAD